VNFSIFGAEADAVAGGSGGEFAAAREHEFKEALRAQFAHRKGFGHAFMGKRFGGKAAPEELCFQGAWLEETHEPVASFRGLDRVGAENTEWIGVAGNEQGIHSIAQRIRDGRFGNGSTWVRHGSILTEEGRRTNGLRDYGFAIRVLEEGRGGGVEEEFLRSLTRLISQERRAQSRNSGRA